MKVWSSGRPKPTTLGPRLRDELLETLSERYALVEGPVVLRVRFVFKRDPALPRAVPTNGEPSLAALTRAVLDELPGLVYGEERQVVAIHAGKEYGNVSGVELRW